MPAYVESARNYAEQNWPVFPCNPLDKRPLTHRGFLDATCDSKIISQWWKQWPNAMIGVPMGAPTNVFCVDLDIKEKADGRATWSMLLASNGADEPATRIHETPSGGKHYLFIWQEGIRSIPLGKLAPGIEIKGNGGYIVVPPSMNSNGKEYMSNGAAVDYAPEWLMDMIRNYRRGRGEDIGATDEDIGTMDPELEAQIEQDLGKGFGPDTNREFGDSPDIDAIQAALDAIPADDYEDWYKLGAAIYKTLGDSGFSLFQRWSQKSKKYNYKDCARKWKQVQNMREVNVGSIFFYADMADPAWREKHESKRERARAQTQEQIKPKQQSGPENFIKLFPIEAPKLPLRPWLVPGLLLRGHLTATAAPGGTGKSLFSICVAIMCRTGMQWGNWHPRGEYKTLILNAEEDIHEMQRRCFGAAHKMGFDNRVFEDWIHLGAFKNMVIAKREPRSRMMYRLPINQQIVDLIRQQKYDIVIVDPFAETFEGDETNTEFKFVAGAWRDVARLTNCAVWLIHHVKKYAQDLQGDVDALRGGGALGNIVRVATTMFTMTDKEAATFGIPVDFRHLYIRFDDAKANYNLPMAQQSWFMKETVQLENGVGDIPGDSVGAFVPWVPPINNLTQEHIERTFSIIDRGIWMDGKFTGEYFTFNPNQKQGDRINRFVGKAIEEGLGCTSVQAKDFLKKWQNANLLVSFEYKSPATRKSVLGCCTPGRLKSMSEPKQETLV